MNDTTRQIANLAACIGVATDPFETARLCSKMLELIEKSESPKNRSIIKVKPLVWTKIGESDRLFDTWCAATPVALDVFSIKETTYSGFLLISYLRGISPVPSRYSTLTAAQEAAQEEWNTFIVACVEN